MTLRSGLHIHPLNGIGTSAQEARQALAGLVVAPGVLDGLTVTGTAGWQYSVAAGHVATTRGMSEDGVVLFANDAPLLVDCSPSPGTGARIDVIYAKHNDSADHGDTDNLPVLAVAEGIASGTPVAPTLPVGAVEVARATVGSGATGTSHANVTIDHSNAATAALYRSPAIAGRRYGGSPQSIPNGEVTTYAFYDGQWDYSGGVAGDSGGMRVPVDGWYQVTATMRWGSESSGTRQVRIEVNGTTVAADVGPASNGLTQSASMALRLYGGDVVRMPVYQSHGSTISSNPGLGMPYLSVAFVGA